MRAQIGLAAKAPERSTGQPGDGAEEDEMLRRLGPMALTIGSLLSAGSASAQQPPMPYAEGMATMPAMAAPVTSNIMAPVNHAAPTDARLVPNPAAFDPYSAYDEMRSRAKDAPLWEPAT